MSSSLELALRASTWSFNSRSCLPLRSPCWSAKVSLSLCTGHVTCRSPGFLQPDDPLRCGTAADHFDIVVGNPRAAVNGAYADEAVKMYKDVLPANVEFIQIREVSTLGKGGPVTYVTRAGETCTLQPEVLVIATGSSYKGGLMKNTDAPRTARALVGKCIFERAQKLKNMSLSPISHYWSKPTPATCFRIVEH